MRTFKLAYADLAQDLQGTCTREPLFGGGGVSWFRIDTRSGEELGPGTIEG